jgi:hypothetical protein
MYPSTERFAERVRAILDSSNTPYVKVGVTEPDGNNTATVIVQVDPSDYDALIPTARIVSILGTYAVRAERQGITWVSASAKVGAEADPGWSLIADGRPQVLADDLFVIRYYDDGPDSLGRRHFMVWWRGQGPLGGEPGTIGQSFSTDPVTFIERARAEGRRVVELGQ